METFCRRFVRFGMKRLMLGSFIGCSMASLLAAGLAGDDPGAKTIMRVPWTTSRMIGSPDPPAPYQTKRVFSKLRFSNVVDLCNAPGTERLFLAEQGGRVVSFRPDADVENADDLIRLNEKARELNSVYGITFHPGFATNRYMYICYVLRDGLADGSRVSRFEVTQTEPPRIDPNSEKILITWISGGHNGGCIKFGRDGYLYISTGDGAGPNPPDPLQTGQDNTDLLSSILRIDPDHPDAGKGYRVPADNPFLNRADCRPEIWAYGLRNPWRMSIDQETGALWVADVGWELWEMVYRVVRGGNYGWSIVEGPQTIHASGKRGPTPIEPPLKSHPHSEAASITGGLVYHGKRLGKLSGAYIYGDWVTGKIWALREGHGNSATVDELVDTPFQIVCFAEDNARELYVVDYGGGIYQLEPNNAPPTYLTFPRKLSETGLFASTSEHRLAQGVAPFEINTEMWADGAIADRFIALPGESRIQTGPRNAWLNQTKNDWKYPTNAVLGKTISIDLQQGKPETRRRLETQVLHFDGLDWRAYTYRWNEAQSDADLVDASGEETTFQVQPAASSGAPHAQTWRFHSRTECQRCHNPWVNVALAFIAPQLNRSIRTSSEQAPKANQLRSLSALGYFDQLLNERASPKFADPYEAEGNITERARSWLHVNCSHCHREGAGGSVVTHFDYDTPPRRMKAIGRVPSQGTLGLTNARVVAPGAPACSILYYRVSTSGQGRMPLIGSKEVDPRGTKLLHDWIAQVPTRWSEDKEEPAFPPLESAAELQALRDERSSIANVRARLDKVLSTPSGALELLSLLNEEGAALPWRGELLARVPKHPLFQVRDLFERFLPDELRPKKLGTSFKLEDLLGLKGDAGLGRSVFYREDVQCARCHRIQGEGREFGPDLSHVASKYSRSQILEQIMHPSQIIDPAFVTYQIETVQGDSISGFVTKRENGEVAIKDADLKESILAPGQVKEMHASQLSAMPEGLLQAMTASEAADLLEFLALQK